MATSSSRVSFRKVMNILSDDWATVIIVASDLQSKNLIEAFGETQANIVTVKNDTEFEELDKSNFEGRLVFIFCSSLWNRCNELLDKMDFDKTVKPMVFSLDCLGKMMENIDQPFNFHSNTLYSSQLDGLRVFLPESSSSTRIISSKILTECGASISDKLNTSDVVVLYSGWQVSHELIQLWTTDKCDLLKGKEWWSFIRHPLNTRDVDGNTYTDLESGETKTIIRQSFRAKPLEFVTFYPACREDDRNLSPGLIFGHTFSNHILNNVVLLTSDDDHYDRLTSIVFRKFKTVCIKKEWLENCITSGNVLPVKDYVSTPPPLPVYHTEISLTGFNFFMEEDGDWETKKAILDCNGSVVTRDYFADVSILKSVTAATGLFARTKYCVREYYYESKSHRSCPYYHKPLDISKIDLDAIRNFVFVISVGNSNAKMFLLDVIRFAKARVLRDKCAWESTDDEIVVLWDGLAATLPLNMLRKDVTLKVFDSAEFIESLRSYQATSIKAIPINGNYLHCTINWPDEKQELHHDNPQEYTCQEVNRLASNIVERLTCLGYQLLPPKNLIPLLNHPEDMNDSKNRVGDLRNWSNKYIIAGTIGCENDGKLLIEQLRIFFEELGVCCFAMSSYDDNMKYNFGFWKENEKWVFQKMVSVEFPNFFVHLECTDLIRKIPHTGLQYPNIIIQCENISRCFSCRNFVHTSPQNFIVVPVEYDTQMLWYGEAVPLLKHASDTIYSFNIQDFSTKLTNDYSFQPKSVIDILGWYKTRILLQNKSKWRFYCKKFCGKQCITRNDHQTEVKLMVQNTGIDNINCDSCKCIICDVIFLVFDS